MKAIKPYYTQYAHHMLRFYCRHPEAEMEQTCRTEIDRTNWRCAQQTVQMLTEKEREFIMFIYNQHRENPMNDSVHLYLEDHPELTHEKCWQMIKDSCYKVAHLRGLV